MQNPGSDSCSRSYSRSPRSSPSRQHPARWLQLAGLLIILTLAVAACAGRGDSPTFTLSGYVRSQSAGIPIPEALVAVPSVNTVTTTNSNGWYQLVGLPRNASNLTVTATASGYQTANQVVIPPVGASATLNFSLRPADPGGSAGVHGIVTYSNIPFRVTPSTARSRALGAASASMVRPTFAPPLPSPTRHITVELRPGPSTVSFGTEYVLQSMMEQVRDLLAGSRLPQLSYRVFPHMERLGMRVATIEVPADMIAELVAQRLRGSDTVLRAEPAQYVYPTSYPVLIPNDPSYPQQYQYDVLGMPQTWALQRNAGSVRVALVDTGVRREHPDLRNNLDPGYDYIGGDNDPTDPGTDQQVSSHGTHVAGLIGAMTNNSFQVAGTAWYTRIIPLRVLGSGETPVTYAVEAIAAAVSQFHADVINLSLGVRGQPNDQTKELFRNAINAAIAAGATVVAASGNDYQRQVSWPAAYEPVIAVGATDQTGNRASFSNYGPELDVMAPGVDILSTNWNKVTNSYNPDYASGTSMATPIVSGVVALMRAAGLAPGEIARVLHRTAMDIGHYGQYDGRDDETGYGLVNPYLAVAAGYGVDPEQLWIGFIAPDGTPLSQAVHPTFNEVSGIWSYDITGVRAGSGYVFAWLDVDRDGALSEGDYVSLYPEGITITIQSNEMISAPLQAKIFVRDAGNGQSIDPQAIEQTRRLWDGLIKAIPTAKR